MSPAWTEKPSVVTLMYSIYMYKEETKTNASAHNSGPRPLQDPRMQSKYGTRERLGKGFVKQMSFKCGEKD